MSTLLKVKISDYKISGNPDIIATYGLGSCVGLSLYDHEKKIAGLAHIMLPKHLAGRDGHSRGKYADTTIETMLAELEELGCSRENISAKLAGGASMFSNLSKGEQKSIGERNVEAVISLLEALDISLSAMDTGGDYGRSIEFFTETGEMKISSVRHGLRTI